QAAIKDLLDAIDAPKLVGAIANSAQMQAKQLVPAILSAIAYFDAYRAETLPANLIQAQRDFFGAHTFERIDKP
ncbi:hypothetical protein KQH58_16695, partial [Mycetohabitans sp. B6]|nr:hypothetical protein [Mycetohabitans sp. B6]